VLQNASSSTPVRPRTQTSFHPSPTPRSKRALSFSGGASHPKIQALEAEIEHLRSQAMPGLDLKEVEKLRTDVETAKRHALKMENEKMAAERSIQREMEDIKSRLSDANDELQYLRALDGQSVQQELQNAKKDAQKERLALEQELESRSNDLEKRKMDVLRLETRLSEVQDEVGQLRSEASVAVQPDEDEVRGLRESIANLKQELEKRTTAYHEAKKQIQCLEDKLKAASKPVSDNTPTSAQAAKLQRAHQREIEDLQQAKDTLRRHLADSEELVAERDAEIFELKRHMPLPPSSADTSFNDLSAVDTEELKQQLTAKAEQLEEAHQAKALLEDRLQRVETELKQALATASSKDAELHDLREQLESTLSETEQNRYVR
jgi:chromosome segregation ATPase